MVPHREECGAKEVLIEPLQGGRCWSCRGRGGGVVRAVVVVVVGRLAVRSVVGTGHVVVGHVRVALIIGAVVAVVRRGGLYLLS